MFLIVFQKYRKIILDIPGLEIVTYVTVESISGCDFQRHYRGEKSVFLPLTSLVNDPYLFVFFRNVQSPTEAFEPVRHQPVRRADPSNPVFFGNITKNC